MRLEASLPAFRFPLSQIFIESLLCSSRLENIQLAGQLMHCRTSSADAAAGVAQKGRLQYRLGPEKSMYLVLSASREYFNSSTSLMDSCMDLARWTLLQGEAVAVGCEPLPPDHPPFP